MKTLAYLHFGPQDNILLLSMRRLPAYLDSFTVNRSTQSLVFVLFADEGLPLTRPVTVFSTQCSVCGLYE